MISLIFHDFFIPWIVNFFVIIVFFHQYDTPKELFHIAHFIPRTTDFQVWGDASLDATGGYSVDFGFYWHCLWPASITTKSVRYFQRKAKFDGEIILINLLEYMVIIINYVICSHLYKTNKLGKKCPYQTVQNWSDNRSAIAWTRQAAISSAGGKALSRIFCSLCINNNLQCTSNYVNTKQNVIADDISRIQSTFSLSSFQTLFQDHVEPRSCKQFHLNPEFISCLTRAVLLGQYPPLQQLPGCVQ